MSKIVVSAHFVKYQEIEYMDGYILLVQNMTKRRIPKGYYFEDTGSHIYISTFYSELFQHGRKAKRFLIDTETKEWKPEVTEIVRYAPIKKEKVAENLIKQLER